MVGRGPLHVSYRRYPLAETSGWGWVGGRTRTGTRTNGSTWANNPNPASRGGHAGVGTGAHSSGEWGGLENEGDYMPPTKAGLGIAKSPKWAPARRRSPHPQYA